jgi:hypothetical protein
MKYQRGNALVYILIGVALFAALSYTFSRNASTGSTSLTDEQTTLYAHQLINHAQQMEQVVQQMLMTGSAIDDIDFTKPGEAGYGTNAQHQVYHPSGGGMNLFNESNLNLFGPNSYTWDGWTYNTQTNVEWTSTGVDDIIFTFLNISGPVCAKVNEILIGDDTVPVETLPPRNTFSEPEGGNSDLTATNCASCEGKYHFCAQDNQVAGVRAFYNIIASE